MMIKILLQKQRIPNINNICCYLDNFCCHKFIFIIPASRALTNFYVQLILNVFLTYPFLYCRNSSEPTFVSIPVVIQNCDILFISVKSYFIGLCSMLTIFLSLRLFSIISVIYILLSSFLTLFSADPLSNLGLGSDSQDTCSLFQFKNYVLKTIFMAI